MLPSIRTLLEWSGGAVTPDVEDIKGWVEAQDVFHAGTQAGGVFYTGVVKGGVFHTGTVAGDTDG